MLESVEWCSLCSSREAHGTLTIREPVSNELVAVPCCVYCAANPDIWEDGMVVLKERPDE